MIYKNNVEIKISDIILTALPISSISISELMQIVMPLSILDVSNNISSMAFKKSKI